MIQKAKDLLKSVFGYDSFILLQKEIIQNVLLGKDTLGVMPTGGGKSLCYQIPALLLGGTTVVVSPLISLMKDQVEQLTQNNVPAVLLNSSLATDAYRRNVERIRQGEARLLYVAPETLLKPGVLNLLESVAVPLLAIDEAHCISEWGPDFRPEYRQLANVRARLRQAVCIALTAAATPQVRKDIADSLGFGDSNQFIAGFNRGNLLLRVIPKKNPLKQTLAFLKKYPNDSGIIYCATRKQVDDLCAALQSRGLPVCPYHAGLDDAERNRNQERFIHDEVRIVAATIAFGMGINKSNVRFVLHHDLPKNIEGYYQEIGRAGRDGLKAECLLLYSLGDLYNIRRFIELKEGLEKRVAKLQLNAMVQYAESDVCRRIPLLAYFGEKRPAERCGMCDNCLAGDRKMTDLTIAAQKFLSCVSRTGERFGASHITDVLRGSLSEKVLANGHEKLSTHGIGKEYSKSQWKQIAGLLLHKGFLKQDMTFGGLSLTPSAWNILKGKETFFGSLHEPRETENRLEGATGRGDLDFDRELFEILRQKRAESAKELGVPAYVVFSDKTLAEMSAHFPQSRQSLLQINGVGAAKLEKHGAAFISAIKEYCEAKGVREKPRGNPEHRGSGKTRGVKEALIGEAFNSGQSIGALAARFDISPESAIRHLWRYCREGNCLRAEGLRPLITVPDELFRAALKAFDEVGADYLKPVYEALNGQAPYDALKIIGLYRLALQRPFVPPDKSGERPGARKIVCLANSRKYSGRCVAGKELLPEGIGAWVRPVSEKGKGELSLAQITLKGGKEPNLLDIISICLVKERAPHPYQSENRLAGNAAWTAAGAFPVGRLPELCDPLESLWVNGYSSPKGINDLMPEGLTRERVSSSLLFIRTDDLCVIVDTNARGLKKIWVEFRHNGAQYRLPLTDPLVEAGYMPREPGRYGIGRESYLTVSIGEPLEGFCYKLAAAVITPTGERGAQSPAGA